MDVDLGTLEAVLSPYLVFMKDSGVEYVSDALANRLGVMTRHLQETLSSRGDIFSLTGGGRATISMISADGEPPVFSYTDVPFRDLRIIALSEEAAKPRDSVDKRDPEISAKMLKASGAGCLIIEKGHIVYSNEHFCRLLGYFQKDVQGRQLIGFVSRESRADFVRTCEGWRSENGPIEQEIMFTAKTGTRSHLMVRGGWLKRGERHSLWIIMRDVTEHRKLERSLREEQKRFSELFEQSPMGILYISPRGIILECNEFVTSLMGYSKKEIYGSPFTSFVSEKQAEALTAEFHRLFTEGIEIKRHECMLNTKKDSAVTIEYNAQVIYRKGYPAKALMIFNDITDKKALEMELMEKNAEMERTLWDMAEVKDALEARAGELNKATEDLKLLNERLNLLSITDGLTEIYNHRHFQDRLNEEVERLHRQKDAVLSLLILDIDDFKFFNDTYGHQCGDTVLKQLASILKNSIRSIDILARYGGEEFAIILPNSNTEQAVIVAERICETIRSTPFTFAEGTSVKVTVSIGVGSITHDNGGDKAILVKKADSALYAAKAKWKDRVEVWEED
jgi:diguanylate cyclase (GGDEF)-like protein/PAS domain S-box-containing protein